MLKTTRWKPDTCGCVLEYTWDDSVPEGQREHSPARVVTACEYHTGKNVKEVFNKVKEENTGKNRAIARIMELSDVTEEETDREGNVTKKMKVGKRIDWGFDEERNIELDLIGFTEQEKAKAVAELVKDASISDRIKMKGEIKTISGRTVVKK